VREREWTCFHLSAPMGNSPSELPQSVPTNSDEEEVLSLFGFLCRVFPIFSELGRIERGKLEKARKCSGKEPFLSEMPC